MSNDKPTLYDYIYMEIITCHSRKGGTGKTTTVQHLGYCLASRGHKTLIIDGDGQANLSGAFNVFDADFGLVNILRSHMSGSDLHLTEHIRTVSDGLDLMPSSRELFKVQDEIAFSRGLREGLFADILNTMDSWGYAYVVIDTPPSDGFLVANAIVASNRIITPVSCETFGVEGITGLIETIDSLSRVVKRDLTISSLIPTKYDGRMKKHKEHLEDLQQIHPDILTNTIIRTDSRIERAQDETKTVFEMYPGSKSALDYDALTTELIGGN